MDIQLPGTDGLQATALLKQDQATRAILVIALTALAMKGDAERILAAGCDGYSTPSRDALPGVPADRDDPPRRRRRAIGGAMTQSCILVVDDERDNRDLVAIILNHAGFLVLTAASGEEALALLAERRPDLILLDVMMPGMDGHQVAARIRGDASTRGIPIIMVTALEDRESQLLGLTPGVATEDSLRKPFRRAELCERVRQQLALAAHRDDPSR